MRHAESWWIALVVLVLGIHPIFDMGAATGAAYVQEGVGREEGAKAIDSIMARMRSEREKFRSGECSFDGSMEVISRKQPKSNLSGPIRGKLSFDGDKTRFEETRPHWFADSAAIKTSKANAASNVVTAEIQKDGPVKVKKGALTKAFADNQEKAVFWRSDQPLMVIVRSGNANDRGLTDYVDVQAAILYDPISLSKRQTKAKIYDVFLKKGYADMKKAARKREDGRWELSWESAFDNIITKYTLIVNEPRGWTAEEFRCESKVDGAPPRAPDWFLEWVNLTRWDQIDGIWAPVHHERRIMNPKAERSTTYIYNYHWTSVNQPVNDEVFTYKALDVPTTVAIQDTSSGDTDWIRKFPATTPGAETAPEPEPEPASFWRSRAGWTAAAVVLIVGVAAGAILLRGRNRPETA